MNRAGLCVSFSLSFLRHDQFHLTDRVWHQRRLCSLLMSLSNAPFLNRSLHQSGVTHEKANSDAAPARWHAQGRRMGMSFGTRFDRARHHCSAPRPPPPRQRAVRDWCGTFADVRRRDGSDLVSSHVLSRLAALSPPSLVGDDAVVSTTLRRAVGLTSPLPLSSLVGYLFRVHLARSHPRTPDVGFPSLPQLDAGVQCRRRA